MRVHIQKVHQHFPYVHIAVRKASGEAELWSGLVPVSDAGYEQAISVEGWEAGDYIIEAQFLGDFVEQTHRRLVTVSSL